MLSKTMQAQKSKQTVIFFVVVLGLTIYILTYQNLFQIYIG